MPLLSRLPYMLELAPLRYVAHWHGLCRVSSVCCPPHSRRPPPPRDPDCAPIARGDPPAGGGARLTVPPPRARRHRSTAPLQGGLLRVADSVRRPYEVTRLPRLARSDAEGGSCRGTAPPEIMRCCQCGPERQQDGRGGNSSGSTRNPTLRPKRRFAEKNYYIISSYDIRMTLTLNCHSTSMAIVSPTHNPL